MGFLSWFFPTPEDRIARARSMLAHRRFRDARDEVVELSHRDAKAVLQEAENGLVELNLEAAIQAATAGDDRRAEEHVELAESFHRGGLEERFREARRELRCLRTRETPPTAATVEGNDPEEERQMQLALAVENYPDDLRPAVEKLGTSFAEAILALDGGRADVALPLLMGLSNDEPLVSYERARAAFALGDPAAAEKALRDFAKLAGRHRRVGLQNTGVLLSKALVDQRDADGALRVLRDIRTTDPVDAAFPLAQLLFATAGSPPDAGRLEEAEGLARELVVRNPKEPAVYLLLGHIRLAGGHRLAAIDALEQSMKSCCGSPGKCGSRPPDPATQELLAKLYAEQGIEPRT